MHMIFKDYISAGADGYLCTYKRLKVCPFVSSVCCWHFRLTIAIVLWYIFWNH